MKLKNYSVFIPYGYVLSKDNSICEEQSPQKKYNENDCTMRI